MAKITLSTIGSRYGSIDALNANFDAIEEAFENTLSRDGHVPNFMMTPIDMNGYGLLNVGTINGYDATQLGPDLNVVSNNINSVIVTANNIADVNTVAANSGQLGGINIVAASIDNVNAVGTNITKVNTVSDNIGNVTIVGSDLSNEYIYIEDNGSILDPVTATVGVSNIKTVANDITDVSIVANIASDVTAVANNNVDVSTVAADIGDVSIVAQNIADVNSFANTYFIGATEPTGPTIGEGDLWYDTVNKLIKTYNGTIWVAAFVSLSGALLAANNLNDLSNKTQAVTNLFSDNFTIDLGVLV